MPSADPVISYGSVTEVGGHNATQDQIERMYGRYRFAQEFCAGGDVLELACGSGQGLGLLAEKARSVTGIDIDPELAAISAATYRRRPNIRVRTGDAENLDIPDSSFDVALLYEAIYYLPRPERFFREARRVLRKDGTLIVCSANKSLKDFNPSPSSHRYFSADELASLFVEGGFEDVRLYGHAPVSRSPLGAALGGLKRAAVKFHLMPRTMKGKEALKRVFYGRLKPMPMEIGHGMAEYASPRPIPADRPDFDHKVLFAVGKKACR